jgi:protein-S-isoprenylcysteine O-methyltransferase Ste14
MAALLFAPAGTLNYWQAWVFLAVFISASAAVTVHLAIHDPKLLERRMRGGPAAEKESSQKIIIFLAMMGFIGLLVAPAFDRRFGWSRVPTYVCLIGDALIAIGFFLVFLVVRANTYAASTIQVAEDQKVISTGPYAFVRHPMYAGSFPILIGAPLALGSWWGLSALIVFVPALIWRLVEEESFLRKNLPGYTEYTDKVRYRLVPYVW